MILKKWHCQFEFTLPNILIGLFGSQENILVLKAMLSNNVAVAVICRADNVK